MVKSRTKTITNALFWFAGNYLWPSMEDTKSGMFGFLMRNWIDLAKEIAIFLKLVEIANLNQCVLKEF